MSERKTGRSTVLQESERRGTMGASKPDGGSADEAAGIHQSTAVPRERLRLKDGRLPYLCEPAWLAMLLERGSGARTPAVVLTDLLRDSLFYPACGLNGTPVKYLGGFVRSFVYADYLVTEDELEADLRRSGCRGYDCMFDRKLSPSDLGLEDWSEVYPLGVRSFRGRGPRRAPFSHWTVWRRCEGLGDSHGPRGFSLLYMGAEAIATYRSLYAARGTAPRVLAIIQPGDGLGGGWTPLASDDSLLKREVAANRAGMPPFLLYGGFGGPQAYQAPCWSEYAGQPVVRLPERYATLWMIGGGKNRKCPGDPGQTEKAGP